MALADTGSFTHAAERIFIAQPTLSQQIRRLEEIVGTPLLQRRRDGLRLTAAGRVLLEASRGVLSLVDHEVSRTRQAGGLGRRRLRVVLPPSLPETLAMEAAATLRQAASDAEVDVVWLESSLDAECSLIHARQADAGLGWLTTGPAVSSRSAGCHGHRGLRARRVDSVLPHGGASRHHQPSTNWATWSSSTGRAERQPATYDAWIRVARAVHPRFEFTDPPFRHSLPMTLAFAATADRLDCGAHRSQHRGRKPCDADPAIPAGGCLRDGPGRPRTPAAHRVGGPGLERRTTPPAAADPLRGPRTAAPTRPIPPVRRTGLADHRLAERAGSYRPSSHGCGPVPRSAPLNSILKSKGISHVLAYLTHPARRARGHRRRRRDRLAVRDGLRAGHPLRRVRVHGRRPSVRASVQRPHRGPVIGHLLLGLVDLAAGIVALVWPSPTALVLVIVVAIWALIAGFLELFAAFQSGETAGTRALFIVGGLVSIAFGVVLVARPDIGAVTLALLFGLYSLIFGVSEIILGIDARKSVTGLRSVMADAAEPPQRAAGQRRSLRERDAQLGEHVAQVPLDGTGADEQLAPISWLVRPSRASLAIWASWAVRSVSGLDRALAHRLAGGQQLAAGAFGEPFHAHRGQHLVGDAKLLARVDAAIFAPEPFAVEQMRAGQIRTHAGAAEPLDRLTVQTVGGLALAQQGP